MGLYENVKEAAKEKGYSINRLEKELGFPRSYINKFKTIRPSAEKLQKIADFLGVSMDSLINGEKYDFSIDKSALKEGPSSYYLNEETAQIAQEIFENPELRVLFDASRGSSPEDISLATDLLIALKKKGSENYDT